MTLKPLRLIAWLLIVGSLSGCASLSRAQTSLSNTVLATVNGVLIEKYQLDEMVRISPNPALADTTEGRRALLEELISRELVAQDAVKMRLDQSASAQFALQHARQNVLIDLAVNEHLNMKPIDELALKAEYQRQIETMKSNGSTQQYQLRLLVLPTEAQAREAIREIKQGKSMEALVRQNSIVPDRANGGLLDWLLPNQMLPMVSTVVVNLSKGQLSAAPIQTPSGWNVVRVENIREFVPPKFEDAHPQLRASLIQERRMAYLNQLRAAANIQRH